MGEMDLFIGGFSFICGLYCFYVVYAMKRTGIVNTTLLLDRETAQKKCKNPGEFIVKTTPRIIVLGISITLYGGVLLLGLMIPELTKVSLGLTVFFFGVLVWYVIGIQKLKKEYYS